MGDRDRLLERVVAELKRPVGVEPAARRRVLAAIGTTPRRRSPYRLVDAFRRRRTAAAATLAAAAGIAAVALGIFGARLAFAPGPAGESDAPGERAILPVRFVLPARAERSASLVGDFNDWDRAATPLRRSGAGKWSVTVRLAPGRHTYAFVVDGTEWVPDPSAPRAPDDGFGIPSSVIVVAGPE